MNFVQLKRFLGYCTLINFFFLLLTFMVLLFSEKVYAIHHYFYAGSLEEFQKMLYLTMAAYKLLWIFFNVIPYIAMHKTE